MAKRDMVDPNGAAIRSLRQTKGMSRGALATRVGCSYSHIYNIETGRKLFTVELAALIARELEVSVDQITKQDAERAAEAAA